MAKKILISGANPSNATVVSVDKSGKLEEVLVDSHLSRSIRSNIYLGSVARVEHSLQAAFVDYGGEKNGFLPFFDIHPDYYQLPHGDKEAIEMEIKKNQEAVKVHKSHDEEGGEEDGGRDEEGDDDSASEDSNGSEDIRKSITRSIARKYNIQEVIKRGQNILVQVYKDERGNKGASLTTYISLPGRYCVFMPNSMSGIGVSRKIVSREERARIIDIVKKFPLALGMSIVVRTAGEGVSEEDLYRDYEYLIKG